MARSTKSSAARIWDHEPVGDDERDPIRSAAVPSSLKQAASLHACGQAMFREAVKSRQPIPIDVHFPQAVLEQRDSQLWISDLCRMMSQGDVLHRGPPVG